MPGSGDYSFNLLQGPIFHDPEQTMRIYDAHATTFRLSQQHSSMKNASSPIITAIATSKSLYEDLHHKFIQTFAPDMRKLRLPSGRKVFTIGEFAKPKAIRVSPKSKPSPIDTGERPFACNSCNLRFASRGHLARHHRYEIQLLSNYESNIRICLGHTPEKDRSHVNIAKNHSVGVAILTDISG